MWRYPFFAALALVLACEYSPKNAINAVKNAKFVEVYPQGRIEQLTGVIVDNYRSTFRVESKFDGVAWNSEKRRDKSWKVTATATVGDAKESMVITLVYSTDPATGAVVAEEAGCRGSGPSSTFSFRGKDGLSALYQMSVQKSYDAKLASTRADLEAVAAALDAYARDNKGAYPKTAVGLAAFTKGGDHYLRPKDKSAGQTSMKDAWGGTFQYVSPSVYPGHKFDLIAPGADHRVGSGDDLMTHETGK